MADLPDDTAITQHLDELIAELRDRGITPRPLNILHFALESGVSEATAKAMTALLERRQGASS